MHTRLPEPSARGPTHGRSDAAAAVSSRPHATRGPKRHSWMRATASSRRAALHFAAALALVAVVRGEEEDEEGEEGAEWTVTVCYHTGLDCQDESPICIDRTADDEDGLGTCTSMQVKPAQRKARTRTES